MSDYKWVRPSEFILYIIILNFYKYDHIVLKLEF